MTRKDCHQHTSSPLVFSFTLSNFVSPPTPTSSPGGQEGWGSLSILRLSFLLAKRAAQPTGHPGSKGRGLSWRPAGGAA